ncbi:MAG: hypothetical protein ABFS35_23135 [Bacteroidota bacterium]
MKPLFGKKRTISIATAVLLGLIALGYFLSRIDYNLVSDNKPPLFSFSLSSIKDGGTTVYQGLGYQIISWHKLSLADENKQGYQVGTELIYFPFLRYWPFLTTNLQPGIELTFKENVAFIITWENVSSFQDSPTFDDKKLDATEQRFLIPDNPGDPWIFPEGKIDVIVNIERIEDSIRSISEQVAQKILPNNYTVHNPIKTRFGYFVDIEWGSPEENYSGHVLWLMINTDKHTIWWCKCT